MRAGWQFVVVILLALAQVVMAAVTPLAAPNLIMAYLVVASLFFDYRLLLWLGLIGGVVLDLYGPSRTFGFNIAFCLLIVLFAKVIIRLEDQTERLWFTLLVVGGLSLLYSVASLGTVIRQLGQVIGWPLLLKSTAQIIYNEVIAVLLFITYDRRNQRRPSLKRLKA